MPRNNDYITAVEKKISQRLNEARLAAGMSALDLSKEISCTHQQASKYLNGKNRISAGRLYFIAKVLKLPISYFFDEKPESLSTTRVLYLKVLKKFSKLNKAKQQAVSNLMDEMKE